jgi:hypothetical protein
MVMLPSEALDTVGERPSPQIRTTTHHQAGWLSSGMGVDNPDFVAFLHFVVRSKTLVDQNVPKGDIAVANLQTAN